MKIYMASILLVLIFSSCNSQVNVDLKEFIGANANFGTGNGPESEAAPEVVQTYGYRLDATDEEYIAFSGYALAMDSTYLSTRYIMRGEHRLNYALPTNFAGENSQKLDFSNGKKALECEISTFDADLTQNNFSYACGISDLFYGKGILYQVIANGSNITLVVIIDSSIAYAQVVSSLSDSPRRIGMELDANTQIVNIYFDNVPIPLALNTYEVKEYFGVLSIQEGADNLENAGKEFTMRLVLDGLDMSSPYNASTTDPFGGPVANIIH